MRLVNRVALMLALAMPLTAGTAAAEATSAEEATSADRGAADAGRAIFGYSALRAIGAPVRDAEGNEAGAVHDIVIGADGRADRLVVSVGGVLGVGGTLVVVPYDSVTFPRDHAVLVGMTAEEVKKRAGISYPDDDHVFVAAVAQRDDDAATSEAPDQEMQQFLRQAGRRVQEWQSRVEVYLDSVGETGREAAEQAADAVAERWSEVERRWRQLRRAGGGAWDEAKDGFQRAWTEFDDAWKESGAGGS